MKVYNNTLYNNIAANGGGAYIFLVKSSVKAYIDNNVFWQNHASAGSGDSSVVNLYNNNFSGNANFNSDANNTQVNPYFVNAPAHSLRRIGMEIQEL